MEYTPLINDALEIAGHQPQFCIVAQRLQAKARPSWSPGRDVDWDDAVAGPGPGIITLTVFAAGGVPVGTEQKHIFSEWLSLLVKTRSSQAIKKLLDLQPDLARLVTDGTEVEVAIEQVAVGQRVRVRPGERIPLDGRIVAGSSAIDFALVTGEPVPAERGPGQEVLGGAINGTGSLLIEVTATGAEGFLAQVVRHVEDSRALKPGILHLVDRVLRVYTPTVLGISALALAGWPAAGCWPGSPMCAARCSPPCRCWSWATPARSASPHPWRSCAEPERPPTAASSCAPGKRSRPSGWCGASCWTRPAPSPSAGPPSGTSKPSTTMRTRS